LIVAAAIVLEDGRPVLFVQKRVGKDNRHFGLLKFRSMIRQAEKLTGPVLASADDPRVTRVGRLLRATALDELPQLVNILLGHMSFVGPRPERPELVARIVESCPEFTLRHVVRPGLTGPAQVFGHYETDPAEKLVYDLEYIRKASFWWDIRLILRSFWITFTGRWQERNGHVPGGPRLRPPAPPSVSA
jgi:lipopolysaccharide/colanic/teichoic acid biosynthesis glycosyltransferase